MVPERGWFVCLGCGLPVCRIQRNVAGHSGEPCGLFLVLWSERYLLLHEGAEHFDTVNELQSASFLN